MKPQEKTEPPVYHPLKRLSWLAAAMALTVLVVMLAFGHFSRRFVEMEETRMQERLEWTAMGAAKDLQVAYRYRENTLRHMAQEIYQGGLQEQEKLVLFLEVSDQEGIFRECGYVDRQGLGMNSEGRQVDLSEQECFRRAKSGIIALDSLTDSAGRREQIMAVPLRAPSEDKRVGPVVGIAYGIWEMNLESQDDTDQDLSVYLHIVDDDGTYLYYSRNQANRNGGVNVWHDLKKFTFREGSSAQVRTDMAAGRSGLIRVGVGKELRSIHYAPLGIGGGYVFSCADETDAQLYMENVQQLMSRMLLIVTALFLIMLGIVFAFWGRIRKVYAAALDRSANSLAIMEMVLRYSEQLVFEYNVRSRELTMLGWADGDSYREQVFAPFPDRAIERGYVHPDSVETLRQACENIETHASLKVDVRMKGEDGVFRWYRLDLRNVYDASGALINTVGLVANIEAHKQKVMKLSQQAERDELTGLYNRNGMNRRIQEILGERHTGVGKDYFIMMDVDNFKHINDSFGHPFGDKVLREVADSLNGLFREGDLLARVGGDEFVIVVRDIEESVLFQRMNRLCRVRDKIYEVDGVQVRSSVSVGLVETGKADGNVIRLYEMADTMLYDVKNSTKNGWKLYGKK